MLSPREPIPAKTAEPADATAYARTTLVCLTDFPSSNRCLEHAASQGLTDDAIAATWDQCKDYVVTQNMSRYSELGHANWLSGRILR
jgi:hypothetical protein